MPTHPAPSSDRRTPAQLRHDAYAAYLDGRTKRAKQLNRLADQLDAQARRASAKAA